MTDDDDYDNNTNDDDDDDYNYDYDGSLSPLCVWGSCMRQLEALCDQSLILAQGSPATVADENYKDFDFHKYNNASCCTLAMCRAT